MSTTQISDRLRIRIRTWGVSQPAVKQILFLQTMENPEFQAELQGDFLPSVDADDSDYDAIISFFVAVELFRSETVSGKSEAVSAKEEKPPVLELQPPANWEKRSDRVSGARVRSGGSKTSDPQTVPTMQLMHESDNDVSVVSTGEIPQIEDQPDLELEPEELGQEIESITRSEAPTRLDNEILSEDVVDESPSVTPPRIPKRAVVVDMPAVAGVDESESQQAIVDDVSGGTKTGWSPKVSTPPAAKSLSEVLDEQDEGDLDSIGTTVATPDETEADQKDVARAQDLAELNGEDLSEDPAVSLESSSAHPVSDLSDGDDPDGVFDELDGELEDIECPEADQESEVSPEMQDCPKRSEAARLRGESPGGRAKEESWGKRLLNRLMGRSPLPEVTTEVSVPDVVPEDSVESEPSVVVDEAVLHDVSPVEQEDAPVADVESVDEIADELESVISDPDLLDVSDVAIESPDESDDAVDVVSDEDQLDAQDDSALDLSTEVDESDDGVSDSLESDFYRDGDNGHSVDSSEQDVDSLGPPTTPGVAPAVPVSSFSGDDGDFDDRAMLRSRRSAVGSALLAIAAVVVFLIVVPSLLKDQNSVEVKPLADDLYSRVSDDQSLDQTSEEVVADDNTQPVKEGNLGPRLDLTPLSAKTPVAKEEVVKDEPVRPVESAVLDKPVESAPVAAEKPAPVASTGDPQVDDGLAPTEEVDSVAVEKPALVVAEESAPVPTEELAPAAVSEKNEPVIDRAALAASIKAEVLAELRSGMATEKSVGDAEERLDARISALVESRLTKQDVQAVLEPVTAQLSQVSEAIAQVDTQIDEQALVKRVSGVVMERVERSASTGLSKSEIARGVSLLTERVITLEQNTTLPVDENGLAERVYGMVVADLDGLVVSRVDDQPPVIDNLPYPKIPNDPREDYRRAPWIPGPSRFGQSLTSRGSVLTVEALKQLSRFHGKSDAYLADYVRRHNQINGLK